MKIEKVSDKQIRCTLNPGDLSSRHLSLKELAYGSEKARSLFREMLQLANEEVGFVAEDVPLMIEAIPLPSESIMLVITKIDEPDELDTRFSSFAPLMNGAPGDAATEQPHEFSGSAGELLESLKNMLKDVLDDNDSEDNMDKQTNTQALSDEKKEKTPTDPKAADSEGKPAEPTVSGPVPDIAFIYAFRSLEGVMKVAKILKGIYQGENSLYKSRSDRSYYLAVHKSEHTPDVFNKICNIMTEYGERRKKGHIGEEEYMKEHMEVLIADRALQILAGE